MQNTLRALVACACLASLAACGGGGAATGTAGPVPPVSAGLQPATGTPPAAVLALEGATADAALVGQSYRWTPLVTDPNGTAITWKAENVPAWLKFDTATGALSGLPTKENVGRYSGIRIVASNGRDERQLQVEIEVVETAPGFARLQWDAPADRTDGSSAGEIAGYRIYYGRSARQLELSIDIPTASITEAQVSNLTRGTWYFAAAAVEKSGREGDLSEIGSKTIS